MFQFFLNLDLPSQGLSHFGGSKRLFVYLFDRHAYTTLAVSGQLHRAIRAFSDLLGVLKRQVRQLHTCKHLFLAHRVRGE